MEDLVKIDELKGRLWDEVEGDRQETPFLRQVLDIPNRMNNQLMHHNPAGLAPYVDLEESELVFDDGPSEAWVPQAQAFIYIVFALHVQLMIDNHARELREDFEKTCDPAFLSAFLTLEPEQAEWVRKGRNRNAPCPCGSGWKTKRCHAKT